MLKDLVLGDDMLTLSINEGAATGFDYFWLRDNARDPESFDSRSHQRELYTAAVDPMIRPKAARLSDDGAALILDWPDLDIEAHYEAGFLADFSSAGDPMRMPEATPWDGGSIDPEAVRLPYATLTGNEGVTPLLETMLANGFAVLTDCPRDLTAVQTVADSIGYVRQTIFGGLFEFEANENMADSAYTPKELRPHTDGTYSHDAPGVQLLLCVSYEAEGGETIMVDGARIAERLAAEQPQVHADLARIGVTGIYKGDGVVLRARRPILRHDETGRLAQISFNNYDRDIRCASLMTTCAPSTPAFAHLTAWRTSRRCSGAIRLGRVTCWCSTTGACFTGAAPSAASARWRAPISTARISRARCAATGSPDPVRQARGRPTRPRPASFASAVARLHSAPCREDAPPGPTAP